MESNLSPAILLLTFALMPFCGCAYRMPAPTPPSYEQIRIVSRDPQQYRLSVDAGRIDNYDVAQDGRILVAIPSYRTSCRVYLFDLVKVGG
jgi:hypothetical protein